MSEKEHPKYAFPGANPWEEVDAGMTLRDYFAAKAMQGYIAYMGCGPDKVDPIGKDESEPNKTVIARCAYKFADAMIAEREK